MRVKKGFLTSKACANVHAIGPTTVLAVDEDSDGDRTPRIAGLPTTCDASTNSSLLDAVDFARRCLQHI